MKQVNTPNGYLAVEHISGIDVYMNDCFVCELHGKSFDNFTYNDKIDCDKLDNAIMEEQSIEKIIYDKC